MPNSPFLEAKDLHLKKRLDSTSFTMNKGEVLALCGGNGAGKTSLFSILTGMIRPDRGALEMNGQPVKNQSMAYRKSFSYMPDRMLFPSYLTGLEVLYFYGTMIDSNEEEVEYWLKKVGLYEVRHKRIKEYSKGMQQRLNMVQAFLGDPEWVMMDEPTNGLDPYWIYQAKQWIKEEKEKGKTILFSTHTLSMVEEVADTLIFLQNGSILIKETIPSIKAKLENGETLEDYIYRSIESLYTIETKP